MYEIAFQLGMLGWELRTGDAEGSDKAFLQGAIQAEKEGGTEPWVYTAKDVMKDGKCMGLALKSVLYFHPMAYRLSDYVTCIHGRNLLQVVGMETQDWYREKRDEALEARKGKAFKILPRELRFNSDSDWVENLPEEYKSRFVICWTPDGATEADHTGRETGGTGQAIRIANIMGIPVYNLKNKECQEALDNLMEKIKQENTDGNQA